MNRKGFVLIETFLALLVISIGVTGALGALGNVMRAGHLSGERRMAAQEMDHVLFSALANPYGLDLTPQKERSYRMDAQKIGSSTTASFDRQNEYYSVKYRVRDAASRDIWDSQVILLKSQSK